MRSPLPDSVPISGCAVRDSPRPSRGCCAPQEIPTIDGVATQVETFAAIQRTDPVSNSQTVSSATTRKKPTSRHTPNPNRPHACHHTPITQQQHQNEFTRLAFEA